MGGRTAHPDEKSGRQVKRNFSFKKRSYKIEGHDVSKCVKYSLFLFNLVFWLCGGAILGVGIYARLLQNDWQTLSGWSTDPAILLIAVGTIMFFVGFCGCIGALRENVCLLKVFGFTLGIILLLEIAGGVAAFLLQDKVTELTQEKMTEAMQLYHTTNMQTDLDDATEAVQINFACCGATSFRDWFSNNRYYNCTEETFDKLLTGCGVPPACCKNGSMTNTQCGYKIYPYTGMPESEQALWPMAHREDIINVGGCADAVIKWVKDNYILLGGVAVGILVIQIFGICLAIYMVDQIKYIMEFNIS
eukprot:scpid52629/ scgid13753/ Tetraspanin-33; Penumbra; Proerythroblast new membrane